MPLDPVLFVRGLASDIDELRALAGTPAGHANLRGALQQFLQGFVAARNLDDENIEFAGTIFRRAGLTEAGSWAADWLSGLSPSEHRAGEAVLIEFLYGHLAPAMPAAARVVLDLTRSVLRAAATAPADVKQVELIDEKFAAVAAAEWETAN